MVTRRENVNPGCSIYPDYPNRVKIHIHSTHKNIVSKLLENMGLLA